MATRRPVHPRGPRQSPRQRRRVVAPPSPAPPILLRRRAASSASPLLILALTYLSFTPTAPVYASSSSSSSDGPTLDEPFQTSFLHLPHAPCVSLYHRFGRVGCGTLGRPTMTGRLVHWSAVVAADDDGGGGGAGSVRSKLPPYVAVMDEREYSSDNVDRLMKFAAGADEAYAPDDDDEEGAGVLRGVLVLNGTASGGGGGENGNDDDAAYYYYSPAPQAPRGEGTPSEQLSVGASYAWNPNGDGLTLKNMHGLPTAYVTDPDVSSVILDTAKEQGAAVSSAISGGRQLEGDDLYPAIVAEFNYYMGQEDLTSKDCLAWRDASDGEWSPKCLPLGGNSVWAAAGSPEVADESSNAAAGSDDDGGRKLDDNADGDGNGNDGGGNNKKPVVVLATNLDATSMFHDASPGSNAAASNILSLLMAAKLLGSSASDATLDAFPKRAVFAFFQSENYGFVGSRAFLRDVSYPGFRCGEGAEVPAVAKKADSWGRKGCLHPLRTSMDFRNLGEISGMIAVDQVGVPSNGKNFYVHGENAAAQNGDGDGNDDGAFLANVLLQLGSDDYSVSSSSVGADDDGDYPLPPTPLTSLVKLSEGAAGGAVLAGYDDAFADEAYYQSHLDSNSTRPISMEAVAAAATVLARAALASIYDDGGGDYESAAQYASNAVPALDSDDETLLALGRCLLDDGNCDLLLEYGKIERTNSRQDTGVDLGMGVPLGNPPDYYPSIYDSSNGQGFVQVGGGWYGGYTGEEEYGKAGTDAFLLRPSLLEMGVHGLLNDFLGRGSASSSAVGEGDGDGPELKSCGGNDDCSDVPYCSAGGDRAVCTGGKVCVCSRSNYHPAIDEALLPAPNNFTGRFLVRDGEDEADGGADEGVSAMYTEPYWSWRVGVRVYRDDGGKSGNWALGAGLAVGVGCFVSAWFVKGRLKKEKLY